MEEVYHRCRSNDGELTPGKEYDCARCIGSKTFMKVRKGGKSYGTTHTRGRKSDKKKLPEIWLQ